MKADTQLYSEIMEKLEFEPLINPINITVSIHGGIVTLAGVVGQYTEKRAVERAVRSVKGVKGIANELEVNLADCLKRSDMDITQSALNALEWNANVPFENIQVTVEDGNIKLTGEVTWWYERQNAEKAVRNLIGVKNIINQIKVKPETPMVSTTEVKEKIAKEFSHNALIDAQGIRVEVSGSKITLIGQVKSWAEYKEANRAVWSIPGVRDVDNQLQISSDIA